MRIRILTKNAGLCALMLLGSVFAASAQTDSPPAGHGGEMPRLSPRPLEVAGAKKPHLGLNGTWMFHVAPPSDFQALNQAGKDWKPIEVPGEWVMQGFEVAPKTPAGYFRSFTLPKDWEGRRIKLRFDAVYSLCTVWVNGSLAGSHEGGFTPFELDITKIVRPGENTLALSVQSDSFADVLASGNQYATHSMGGITRKVTLFALPQVQISDLKILTTFDPDFHNATARFSLRVSNEGEQQASGLSAQLSINKVKPLPQEPFLGKGAEIPAIPGGGAQDVAIEIPVQSPAKWDCEHPNLYEGTVVLNREKRPIETVKERFGFRQVETRGNQVFLNGKVLKLHGVCRHEVHPLRGRSLTDDQWKQDALLFKQANCNFIRTSHYPPAEEFIQYCDEVGLFVELEAPFCWVGHGANQKMEPGKPASDKILPVILRGNLETSLACANHPSVIMRSMANESVWYEAWDTVFQHLKMLDPSRLITFHDQSWGDYNNRGSGVLPVANYHYPDINGPQAADKLNRPITFGEYCHLNTYNRHELAADPGVRDAYGRALKEMYDLMDKSTGNLGGSIWSGVDDLFFLPDGHVVGYGEWGPIDGWRRRKPEWWHVRKVYSPVRIEGQSVPVPAAGQPLRVEIENRHCFTDLNEVKIEWSIGQEKGILKTDLPPRSKGALLIPTKQKDLEGADLSLAFTSPQGFALDEYRLRIGEIQEEQRLRERATSARLQEKEDVIRVEAGNRRYWEIDRKTGQILRAGIGEKEIIASGPNLMILRLNNEGGTQLTGKSMYLDAYNDVCKGWKMESIKARMQDLSAEIEVKGRYEDAAGSYTLRVDGDGDLTVNYDFEMLREANPRQWGMVFELSRDCDTLEWNRKALWTVYPEDHIGRPRGRAVGRLEGRTYYNNRKAPDWPWSLDENTLGSNDFRATRENIRWASLTSGAGRGIRVESDGKQAFRAWLAGERIGCLAAGFSTGGADGFLATHYAKERKPLKKGAHIQDSIVVRLCGK